LVVPTIASHERGDRCAFRGERVKGYALSQEKRFSTTER
jgi:hypothetical protein